MDSNTGWFGRAVKHPPFLAAVLVLLAATVSAGPLTDAMRVALRKDPVPLQKPLAEFDREALPDYEFLAAQPVDKAILNQLKAADYAQWRFVDRTVENSRAPLREVSCFISHNTGRPGLAPHIPDNCYLGAGYELTKAENLSTQIPGADGDIDVPVRAVTFVRSDVHNRATPTVVYTFHCNGEFVNTRTAVRTRMGNPFDKGAYFCKIEVTFGGPRCLPQYAGREESIEAAEKFLSQLLPALLRDHLPDAAALKAGDAGS